MILSHKYRFIFLKTAKTAGTSVEIALSQFLGDRDIITPISDADERIRRQLGYRGPQNFRIPLSRLAERDNIRRLLTLRRPQFYNHISATEVRSLIGETIWNDYFKFCIERNPCDRVISLYYWCHKSEPRPTLSEFIDQHQINTLTQRGIDLYTGTDGDVTVDHVVRYENLQDELEQIRLKLGIPGPLNLPRAKSAHRTDRRHFSEVLDDASRKKVATRFHREIRMFGYQS
jgi:hypothetical protein